MSRTVRYQILMVCGLLVLAVGLVFGKTVLYNFVEYDDNVYVRDTPIVTRGLTAQGIAWAFTANVNNMAFPLTWLSYMLDFQLHGAKPWGFHLTNVLLHAASSIVLFLALRRMTGELWASAVVALLFAIHPLQVETVAWVGERKGVLSGFLALSAVAAYVAYANRPLSLVRYLLVAALFALALLAKPTIIVLPLLLLLLDYWPLGRAHRAIADNSRTSSDRKTGSASVPWLLIEKIPLLLLGIGGAIVAVRSQTGNIVSLHESSLAARIANSLISSALYVGRFVRPVNLAAFYPRAKSVPTWHEGIALLVLGGISVVAYVARRSRPAVSIGWMWYLVCLLPMSGIVPIGEHARADRYMYLPLIGLCLAAVWGMRLVLEGTVPILVSAKMGLSPSPLRSAQRVFQCGSALLIAVLMACAWKLTSVWRDSESLWIHALASTGKNALAHNGLGVVLLDRGDTVAAVAHFHKALEIEPGHAVAHSNLGLVLANRGLHQEALVEYHKSLQSKPAEPQTHYNIGNSLARLGLLDAAIDEYRKALWIRPDYVDAHNNLGNALSDRGRIDEAIAAYRKALELRPDRAEAHFNLGDALVAREKFAEAIAEYRTVLQLYPDRAEAHYHLGKALAGCGRVAEAATEYRKALEIDPGHAGARQKLEHVLSEPSRRP